MKLVVLMNLRNFKIHKPYHRKEENFIKNKNANEQYFYSDSDSEAEKILGARRCKLS